jgi:gamma-glutamyltranspeptidase/glutathione hydrolase
MSRVLKALLAALLLSGGAPAFPRVARRPAQSLQHMGVVSAADPRAAAAGIEMLRRGGSATDAAIAVMLALNVVEPQNSGIGGGGFFLRSDGKTHRLASIDGRETAPRAADPNWFMGPDGKPLPPMQMYVGGKSAGVPGALAMMWTAHQRYGRLPWATLFQPAVKLARDGFMVSARMHNGLKLYGQHATGWARQAYFGPDGQPIAEGAILRLPALADTLERIGRQGIGPFYHGDMPKKIAVALDTAERSPSKMTAADVTNYRAKDRSEVCESYRGYRVCGVGPPAGGIVVLMILKQLERFDMARLGRNSPVAWHLLAESERVAYADRDTYLGDPDFVSIPVKGLLDPAYLARRSALIQPNRTLADIQPGNPAGAPPRIRAPFENDPGTSDLAVVDGKGDVVEVTTTINGYFGSGVAVDGFMINNELPDFDQVPVKNGYLVANRVEGGKRPRSSMSPIIVYGPDGKVRAALGAAGGATIICQVAKALVGVIDWHMSLQDAIAMGLIYAPGKVATLEKGTELEAMLPALQRLGENVRIAPLGLKANGVEYVRGRWVGAADPRSEGVAMDTAGHVSVIGRRSNDLNGAHE